MAGFEIDFLPVGDGEKSGDAIALRYGNLVGEREEQRIVVIDGGFQASAEALVEHIRKYYGTDTVDLVVSTHPDNDHASGLSIVLEKLQVKELWMHCPWNYDSEVANYVSRRSNSISRPKLQKSLDAARSLESLANKKGIPIKEPFTGVTLDNGILTVVGPTIDFYKQLLPEFRGQPAAESVAERFVRGATEVVRKLAEAFNIETLTDDGETSAENESSVILLFHFDGEVALLTADAGQRALSEAADTLENAGFDLSTLNFIQVPHHGSQRNVGPTILDRILGPKQSIEKALKIAFASVCCDGAPKHPSKKVTNAFRRRGAPVHATLGTPKRHSRNAPARPGWSASEALPLYGEVED